MLHASAAAELQSTRLLWNMPALSALHWPDAPIVAWDAPVHELPV